MGEKTRDLLIGLFILAAIAVVIGIILFLKPSVGNGKEILYVRFSNINKISIGTRVTYAGRPVGEVVAINEIHDARDQPSDALGRVYFYQLTLRVDSSVKVYDTDEVALQTSGLLGEKSVAIVPKSPPPGVVPRLITNQPIYANSVDPIENTFNELNQLADELNEAVSDIREWFNENKDEISHLVKGFSDTMNQMSITITDINEQEVVKSAKDAMQNFADVMCQADEAMTQMHAKDTFNNVGDTMHNLKHATASIEVFSRDIANGKGTIGRLIKDDDMYLRFSSLMSKADTMMNDINHYGLLFNNNKKWQRLRTQRANTLASLETPQQFKNYFEAEVDLINTAMSRLSIVVERSEQNNLPMESEAFKKDFADLMRQVDALGDNLRLYNEQLMESQSSNCNCPE